MAEVLKETLLQFLCCHPDSTCKKNISTEHFITWNKRPFLRFWKEKEEKQKLLDHINQLQVKLNQKNLCSALNTNYLNIKLYST